MNRLSIALIGLAATSCFAAERELKEKVADLKQENKELRQEVQRLRSRSQSPSRRRSIGTSAVSVNMPEGESRAQLEERLRTEGVHLQGNESRQQLLDMYRETQSKKMGSSATRAPRFMDREIGSSARPANRIE